LGNNAAPAITWNNKHGALLYELSEHEGKGLTSYWVSRNDIRVREARPLVLENLYRAVPSNGEHEIRASKTDDAGVENMLIQGDNLLSLLSLRRLLAQKDQHIKCIYIDPPYNTQQAFEYYDDSMGHSEWLTMMRDRLVILHSLLSPDGTLFLQLDDNEVHYAKVLLDEIFGRQNFVNMICYERSGTAGIGQGGNLVDIAEFILIYAKDKNLLQFNTIPDTAPLDIDTMRRYNKILENEGKKELVHEFVSRSNGLPVKIYRHSGYEIRSVSLRDFAKREKEVRSIYTENFSRIFRTTNPQVENSFQHELISLMTTGELYSVEYTPSRGKNKNRSITTYYNNQELFAWLKDSADLVNGEIVKRSKLSTIWRHAHIPKADLANEGGVELKRSKKPEQLIKRILELATREGDYVLDCFSGSGTTCCVAHKMNRKWIGIEVGRQAEELFLKRALNVISGRDHSGISKAVRWQGGGAFKYYKLGPSIIKLKDGKPDFNWELGKQFIEESLLASYDYNIISNTPCTLGIKNIENNPWVGVAILAPSGTEDPRLHFGEIMAAFDNIMKRWSPASVIFFINRSLALNGHPLPAQLEIVKVP